MKQVILDSLQKLNSADFIKGYSDELSNLLGTSIELKGTIKEMDDSNVLFLESPKISFENKLVNSLFKEMMVTAFSDYDIKNNNALFTIKFYLSCTSWTGKEVDIPIGYSLYETSYSAYKFVCAKDAEPDMIREYL